MNKSGTKKQSEWGRVRGSCSIYVSQDKTLRPLLMSFSDEQDGRGNGASNEEYGPFTEIGCRRPDINVRKNVESQPQLSVRLLRDINNVDNNVVHLVLSCER